MRQGWDSPRGNSKLVHVVNKQMLMMLGTEKKLLPSSVINQVAKARAAEMEEQQGFAPGKKAMKDLKERVADELLPRAFSIRSNIFAWIDPINGWLVIDAASPGKAEEVIKLLLKSVDKMPLESLRVQRSPADRIRPRIPIEYDMWDIATIADCLKCSEAQVRERLAPQPDFPKAIRLPTTTGGRGKARYRAAEVIRWMLKYQDKH